MLRLAPPTVQKNLTARILILPPLWTELRLKSLGRISSFSHVAILVDKEVKNVVKMAVDGRKLSDTLRHGSDNWNENPCSPCAKEGRNVAAVKYCVDCNENICGKCVSDHNKFAMMRGHQISDKLSTETGKKRPELPTQRCDKHGGKLVDVYCSKHDEVGCATCIAVDHSSCKGITFIPEAAKSNKIIADINELELKLKAFLITLDTLTKQKENQKTHMNQEKEQLLNEIRKLRKQINDHFDKMENDLVAQVESLFSSNVTLLNTCINDVGEITKVIERSQKHIEKAKYVNEAEMFVQQKLANAIFQETRKV